MPKATEGRSCSPAKCPIAKPKSHQDHLALRTDIPAPNIDPDSADQPNGGSATHLGRESQAGGSRVQFQKHGGTDEDNISTELSTVQPLTDDQFKTDRAPAPIMGKKIGTTKSGVVYYLETVREPVVDYQESRGISRNEDITFVTLITSLCTQAYTAAITILVMLWNLMPLVDGFVYFFRFILDKLIDIVQTEDTRERVVKALIFVGELIVTFFLIFLILGLIFMPVYVLLAQLTSKIFSMVAW